MPEGEPQKHGEPRETGNGAPPSQRDDAPEPAGRWIGRGLFWTLASFIVTTGTLSIAAQVFPDTFRGSPDPEQAKPCAEIVTELKGDLIRQAGESIAQTATEEQIDAWLQGWDRRYEKLSGRCGVYEPLRTDLKALRNEVGALLERYRSEPLPVIRRIEQRLDEIQPPPSRES